MNDTRIEGIRRRLTDGLSPQTVEVRDDSHLHAGHAGARDGRGHFAVRVVADCFEGLPRIQRHRKVYGALGDMMTTDIHALNVVALTPAEAAARTKTAGM